MSAFLFEWLKISHIQIKKERENYMNKAEIAFGLQQEAQNLAEEAIRELEDFICDDARLVRSKFFLIDLSFYLF